MNCVGGRLPALVFASYTKVNDNGRTTSANQSNMAALLPPCAIFTYEKNINNVIFSNMLVFIHRVNDQIKTGQNMYECQRIMSQRITLSNIYTLIHIISYHII